MRHLLLALTVLGLAWPARAAAPPPAQAAAPAEITQTLDIHYGDEERQRLDVFAPKGARGTPVVFFVHGGTWMIGDKNCLGLYRKLGHFLASHGVTAVLINYRLSPLVQHPEHARDVARALAWTYHNVGRYGGDRGRIVVAGHSAGGHLATLVVTDPAYLADPALKLPSNVLESVRGVVGVCGVYRIPGPAEFNAMLSLIVRNWAGSHPLAPVLMRAGQVANPFRLVFGEEPRVWEGASPLSHVRAGLPPFLLLSADGEVPGLAGQAVDFAAALRKAGVRVEACEVVGSTHSFILFGVNKPGDTVGRLLLDFVARVTGPKS